MRTSFALFTASKYGRALLTQEPSCRDISFNLNEYFVMSERYLALVFCKDLYEKSCIFHSRNQLTVFIRV